MIIIIALLFYYYHYYYYIIIERNLYITYYIIESNFWILEADSFFLLKWNVFNSNKFFLVKLTLSKLN